MDIADPRLRVSFKLLKCRSYTLPMGFPHPIIPAHKSGKRYRLRRGKCSVPPGAMLGAGHLFAKFAFIGPRNLMPYELLFGVRMLAFTQSRKIGLQGVGWHSFRHTYRTLIDDIGTPLGVQQRLMRHADIKTTMNTYGSAFEKTKRRANSRVADLVLPLAIKRQLKDRAKEVSLKNLRPETATIQ